LVAFASSLDQVGVFGRCVEDVANTLGIIAGHDDRDSTSLDVPVPNYAAEVAARTGPWKLGLPREYFGDGLDPEVRSAVEQAVAFYRDQGCEILDVSLPYTEYAVATYYIIATAEASSNLARYDGVRYGHRSASARDSIDVYFQTRAEGFGEEVKRRIILGTYVLSSGYYDAYYLRAQKVRTLIRNDFLEAFKRVDALITPTSPVPAFKKGERTADPLAMYLADIYTISANLAGLPGLSIPCGFTKAGLPIGLQVLGKPFEESTLLAIGRAFEQVHDFHLRRPTL
jgi:aspartyl-tRNA(Asn)/glutamyl-tRNA(Gln) amidotransferase subunit A